MGTRGTVTIRYKKDCKPIFYFVPYDSYYSGLGEDLIRDIKLLLSEHSVEELIEMFSKVKVYEGGDEFSQADLKIMKKIVGPTVEDERKSRLSKKFVSAGMDIPDFCNPNVVEKNEIPELVNRLCHSPCYLLKFGKYLDERFYEEYNYFVDFCGMPFKVKCGRNTKEFPLNDIPVEWYDKKTNQ